MPGWIKCKKEIIWWETTKYNNFSFDLLCCGLHCIPHATWHTSARTSFFLNSSNVYVLLVLHSNYSIKWKILSTKILPVFSSETWTWSTTPAYTIWRTKLMSKKRLVYFTTFICLEFIQFRFRKIIFIFLMFYVLWLKDGPLDGSPQYHCTTQRNQKIIIILYE